MENEIKILQDVASSVTERKVTFDVTVIPQNWLHKLLMNWGLLPKQKSFCIAPLVFGNLIRISDLLLSIDYEEIRKGVSLVDMSYRLASRYGDTLARIMAIAIENAKHEPSGKLEAFLKNNLSSREMMTLLGLVLQQMDLTNFISTIVSIRGLNVLDKKENKSAENEASPSIQES